MKSAKSVRSTTDTDYQCASQGNISNPRANVKRHNAAMHKAAVGGTDNMAKAMFAPADYKLCRIAPDTAGYRDGKAYVPNTTSTDYHPAHNTNYRSAGPRRSDNLGYTNVARMPVATLIKRAERMDMTLAEYAEFIGYPLSDYSE